MSTSVPVSVIVPIKNEAANLPRCLASVKWADEILVVDSAEHRWFDRDRPTARRQSGAVRIQWYLAEEKELGTREPAVSQRMGFCSRCRRSFAAGSGNGICPSNRRRAGILPGYWINRRFMFMGRWLRHAYYPNWNLRLFRHALGRYEKLTDAPTNSGDNEVHEHVLLNGAHR